MIEHTVRVHPSREKLPREQQLAWKIAAFAVADAPLDANAVAMAKCRIIDNAAVALAAINRGPVVSARAQALAHPRPAGATMFGLGLNTLVDCEWATISTTAFRTI